MNTNESEKLKELINNRKFIENNGRILRILNVVGNENRLKDIHYVLSDMEQESFKYSVNYLCESGYIKLFNGSTKAEIALSASNYDELYVKITPDGIKLLTGKKSDDCIEV